MRKAKRKVVKSPGSTPAEKALLKPGFGYEVPPEFNAILIYFDQKGLCEQAKPFYDHHDEAFWLTPKGRQIKNWKVIATDWIFNHQQNEKLKQRLANNSRFL